MTDPGHALFAAALVELDHELDWARLGEHYCDEGGESFFGEEDRASLRDVGLLFATDLLEAVADLDPGGPRRSLYFGAALFELAPMLADSLIAEREVVAINLPGDETDELNVALAAVEERVGRGLPRVRTDPLESLPRTGFDLAWSVSVLTDPDAFPALHDRLYGRRGGELATGRGDLELESVRAEELVAQLHDRLVPPAVLVTTDEELGFHQDACEVRRRPLRVPDRARLSAVVGDPVRFCVLPAPA